MAGVRKAVITAAGRGTRLYPATVTLQKELFPLVDVDGFAKPTLQIIVEEALASGIEEVCIVANPRNAPVIRAHFTEPTAADLEALAGKPDMLAQAEKLAEMSRRVSVVVQERQEGFGHALHVAQGWVGDTPFLLLLGDHVYVAPRIRCARQVIDCYERWQAPVSSVDTVAEADVSRLGIVAGQPMEGRAYRIERVVEKPTPAEARRDLRVAGLAEGEYLAFFGIHAFTPAIFDCLARLIEQDIRVKGEIQLTSAIGLLVEEAPLYVAARIEGRRCDMGIPEGLVETQIALAQISQVRSRSLQATDQEGSAVAARA